MFVYAPFQFISIVNENTVRAIITTTTTTEPKIKKVELCIKTYLVCARK